MGGDVTRLPSHLLLEPCLHLTTRLTTRLELGVLILQGLPPAAIGQEGKRGGQISRGAERTLARLGCHTPHANGTTA